MGAVLLSSAMNEIGVQVPKYPWIAAVPVLFIAVSLLIAILRKARTGRPIIQIIGDERMEMIYAKSARNALFFTYLAFFIHLLIADVNTLDVIWVLLIVASGLVVLIVSTLAYYYRKS
jgi:hypothetical protein